MIKRYKSWASASVRAITLGLLIATLAGCLNSVLPEPESSRLYTLPGPASEMSTVQSPWRQLVIDELIPAPALDSDRLLAIGANGEVQRISQARWIARPAELVRAGLAERLHQVGAAASVDRQALRLAADLRLLGTLQDFAYDPDQRSVRVTLDLHLLCAKANRNLADQRFTTTVDSSADPGSLIAAHASALDQLAMEIGRWIAAHSPSRCAAEPGAS